MKNHYRETISEYLDSQRQLKSAWDSFHRRALRQTFIHCQRSLNHLINAVILLEGGDPGIEPLNRFFEIMADKLPLDKAANFNQIFQPPELKPFGPIHKDRLNESVNDWLITREISSRRVFEQLNLTQETVNLTINLMGEKYPLFFDQLNK